MRQGDTHLSKHLRSHDQDGRYSHMCFFNLLLANRIFFLGTEYVDIIQLQALKFYQVCSNDDPRLTFDLFIQRSTLVSCTFVFKNA